MANTSRVYIIILNWNGWQMTLDCLKSLSSINTDGLKVEIVVVDNGSADDSINKIENEKIKDKNDKLKLQIIRNDKNLGFAEGNNIGIRYALKQGADYICLLNNDTRVDKNFLSELVICAENNPQAGVIGGKIYFEKDHEFHKDRYSEPERGKVIWYAGGLIDWKNVYGSNRGVDEVDKGQYDEEIETDYVNGCLMLLRANVIKQIGLFNKKYFLYYEDTDLSVRIKKAGYSLLYCPKAIIWHINAGSSGTGSNLHDYFTTRNRLLFGIRWAPLRAKIALLKESARLMINGRQWQKTGVRDYYLGRFGRGSWR